jgi:hypothetical protein
MRGGEVRVMYGEQEVGKKPKGSCEAGSSGDELLSCRREELLSCRREELLSCRREELLSCRSKEELLSWRMC